MVVFTNRTDETVTISSNDVSLILPARSNSQPVNIASFFRTGIHVKRGECLATYPAPKPQDRPVRKDGEWTSDWWPGLSKKYTAFIIVSETNQLNLELENTKSHEIRSVTYFGFPTKPISVSCPQ